jgi:hypothetical protein
MTNRLSDPEDEVIKRYIQTTCPQCGAVVLLEHPDDVEKKGASSGVHKKEHIP